MRDFHGSDEEAYLLVRCDMALGCEGIGPIESEDSDGEIVEAAARRVWRKFSWHDLDEAGLLRVVPGNVRWDIESQSWRSHD